MSGIVGIFRRDAVPVSPSLLQALTKYQAFRGPDAQEVWVDGPVGFGHTMLRTTREGAQERQPIALDGRYWITADVRLDARAELIEKLRGKGEPVDGREVTDPELILRAYRAWGESCIDRLRGDFAFAIWHAAEKKLFCARDHFGIKPFFYAVNEKQFQFSNTLNCLRTHPDVSDELNDGALGDFLLFGLNCNLATTTFSDIQRLPPAHLMVVSNRDLKVQQYWSPPIDGRVRYRRSEEYVEHFRDVFEASVKDRLDVRPTAIFLSGGLDSGSIAAAARKVAGSDGLWARTTTFESLFDDSERAYASETARYLDLPVEFVSRDESELFKGREDFEELTPEPVHTPFVADILQGFQTIAAKSRVILSGEGADNLMEFEMWPYVRDSVRRREWRRVAKDMLFYAWVRNFPWRGLAVRAKQLIGVNKRSSDLPAWIEPSFASREGLALRFRAFNLTGPEKHPVSPGACTSLSTPLWAHLFENADAGVTQSTVEVRYPFLDLRVVEYLLAIPPFPWLFRKSILRKAMAGALPESVLRRAKTPLPVHVESELLKRGGSERLDGIAFGDQIRRYVSVSNLPQLSAVRDVEQMDMLLWVFSLNFWLRGMKVPAKFVQGVECLNL